ncbi:MAG: hypothetical protein Q7S53_05185 [bacterium]|nr:hypothetical protein [bacterium]
MKELPKYIVLEKIYKSRSIWLNKLGVFILSINQQRKLGGNRIPKNENLSFEVQTNPSIPPLAWICKISDDKYHFTAGENVEHSKEMIFEGAWDGDFKASKVEDSEFVFGSGAVLKKGKVIFIPPKHTLELLYVLHDRKGENIYVSNSICFILQSAKVNLNGSFFKQISDCLNSSGDIATRRGIDRYEQLIASDSRYSFYRMMFYNFSVDSFGKIQMYRKLPKKYFSNYPEYRKFLSDKTAQIFANARSKDRKFAYNPITSVSKGYDSPAVSVIAKENGCEDALTLDVVVGGVDDSGTKIAKKLGMNTTSCKYFASDKVSSLYMELKGRLKDISLEFIASSGVGDDVTFYPFRKELKKKLFLTGIYGDAAWGRVGMLASKLSSGEEPLNPGLPVQISYCKSINEFRLMTNFIYVPLPFIGARFPYPLKKISNSPGMKEYSIGGDYDRPIPRRIVEEAGIQRSDFGAIKSATAPLIMNHRELFKEAIETVSQRYVLQK